MDYDSDSSVCSDIEKSAAEATSAMIPEKSKLIYEKAYKDFCNWMAEKNAKTVTGKVVLAYFNDKSKLWLSSSLWSEYSKLKCTVFVYQSVDISKFKEVTTFLKKKNVGHVPKKSKVLRKDDFEKFLTEADDEKYLLMKVVLIFGIAGGCRRCELMKLSTKDVTDEGSFVRVLVPDTKTYVAREFVITEGCIKYNLLEIIRKYIALRKPSTPHDRFFVNYQKGLCTIQPVGINTIGGIPKKIASFCGLPDPALYTGHCFRRSSASLLANAGGDLIRIKQHGGWKSDKVAMGYIESSIENKCKTARQILGVIDDNKKMIGSSSTNSIGGHLQPVDEDKIAASMASSDVRADMVCTSTGGQLDTHNLVDVTNLVDIAMDEDAAVKSAIIFTGGRKNTHDFLDDYTDQENILFERESGATVGLAGATVGSTGATEGSTGATEGSTGATVGTIVSRDVVQSQQVTVKETLISDSVVTLHPSISPASNISASSFHNCTFYFR